MLTHTCNYFAFHSLPFIASKGQIKILYAFDFEITNASCFHAASRLSWRFLDIVTFHFLILVQARALVCKFISPE